LSGRFLSAKLMVGVRDLNDVLRPRLDHLLQGHERAGRAPFWLFVPVVDVALFFHPETETVQSIERQRPTNDEDAAEDKGQRVHGRTLRRGNREIPSCNGQRERRELLEIVESSFSRLFVYERARPPTTTLGRDFPNGSAAVRDVNRPAGEVGKHHELDRLALKVTHPGEVARAFEAGELSIDRTEQ
jgi:hypothetical protein